VALRLIAAPAERIAVLLAVASVDGAVRIARGLVDALPHVRSVELMLDAGLELVRSHARLAAPFPRRHPCYLLVEVAGPPGVVDELAAALGNQPDIAGDVVAVGTREIEDLFAYRERHTEAIAGLGVPHKFDIAVSLDRVAPFLAELDRRMTSDLAGATCISFGHVAEGNLHVNVLAAPGTSATRVDDVVLGLVLEHRGTISAEHGIGVAKAAWLERMRGPADVAAMRAIKFALDPAATMNPGVIFPNAEPVAAFG
jgi:FAD/FMN-containing dehydrogenase